jgi:hypothetical protein
MEMESYMTAPTRDTARPANSDIRSLISMQGFADIWGTTYNNVKTLMCRNPERLPEHIRIGRKVYFRPEDVENWIEAQRRQGPLRSKKEAA